MLADVKRRYRTLLRRLLDSLSEVERRDVRAFDRWFYAHGGWRWLAGVMVATTAVAWIASRLPWNMSLVEATVLFNVVVLLLIWSGLSAWFGYRRFQRRIFRYIVLVPLLALCAVLIGGSIVGLVRGVDPFVFFHDSARLRHLLIAAIVFGVLFSFVTGLIAHLRNREYRALTRTLVAEARQSATSRQLAESKLKLLQLQIEPHFLFNTLGSAQQLAEKRAPDAAALIGDLIRFLRAAAPALRDEVSTVRQEATMIRAYLAIMATRLGKRLAWSVEIADEIADCVVPPGMLITLTENAIKHGIEPLPRGGRVDVSAQRRGADIVLVVSDTGAGLTDTPSASGIGLANIRERLGLLYGGSAALLLEANEPCGFRASIVLPAAACASPERAAGRAIATS